MEYQKISSYKIKLLLSAEDLMKYGIDLDGGYDTKSVRGALREMLSELGVTDFTVDGERLLVRIYPVLGSGAEIAVTRLSIDKNGEDLGSHIKTTYIRFEHIDTLRHALCHVDQTALSDVVYREYRGAYIVTVREEDSARPSAADILSEFGERDISLKPPFPEEWYTPIKLSLLLEGK